MKGLFEVHLITTPEHQSQLFGFITNLIDSNDKSLIRPRPTCAYALYGNYPNQPMFTFWVNGHIDEVNKVVYDIEARMAKMMPVLRTKIEAMAHNEGVPNVCSDDHYFEYHFKVPVKNTTEWNLLVEIITPYGAHLFYNPYNKNLTPIVTLRRYTSLDDLDHEYKYMIKDLEYNQFVYHELEKEYSVYDSNVELDQNWLFTEEKDQFIKEVSDNMLFQI